VTRAYDDVGNYSIERSVRTVERAGEDRVVDVADAIAPEFGGDITSRATAPRVQAHRDIGWGSHPALLGMEE
jgi:hypothetical protein